MRKQFIISFFLFTTLLFHSCKDWFRDPFYSATMGWDVRKIPLIKPYYLGSTTGIEGPWYLTDAEGNGLQTVSVVNVVDSIIISYYFNKYIVVPANRDTTWYILIPSNKQEYTFSSEKDFFDQVVKHTDKPVEFIEVPILYRDLAEKGYLDWYPEEYKNK